MRQTAFIGLVVLAGCNAAQQPPGPIDTHLHTQHVTIEAHPPLADVMIAVDRSLEAAPYLDTVRTGLEDLLAKRPDAARFGLAAFPNPEAASCAADSSFTLASIPQTEDDPAVLATQATLIGTKLDGLAPPSGDRNVGDAIASLATTSFFSNDRERFILLLTNGLDACGADVLNRVLSLRTTNRVRTIVIGLGASASQYDGIAAVGGFSALCANATDAECGPHATCDSVNHECSHTAFRADDVGELEAVLDRMTTPLSGDTVGCTYPLDLAPTSAARLTVSLGGELLAPGSDTWQLSADRTHVTFVGSTCTRLQQTASTHPLRLELTIDDRP